MQQRKLLPPVFGLLLLALSSSTAPVFNKNFVFRTWSSNSEIVLLCVPTNCTNDTDGCISLYRKKAKTPYRQLALVKSLVQMLHRHHWGHPKVRYETYIGEMQRL